MGNLLERVLEDKPECMMKNVSSDALFIMEGYKRFICQETYNNNASISVNKINCSDHPNYINKPWLNILENAPRIKENLAALERNPDYYLGRERKNWSFKKIIFRGGMFDGCQYLLPYHNGNHRTAIAKAFLYYEQIKEIHGIMLFEEIIDGKTWDSFRTLDIWKGIINIPFFRGYLDVDVIRKNTTLTEDTEEKYTNKHQLALKLTFKEREMIIDASETEDFVKELKTCFPLRFFRSNKYAKFLR